MSIKKSKWCSEWTNERWNEMNDGLTTWFHISERDQSSHDYIFKCYKCKSFTSRVVVPSNYEIH